MNTTKAKIPLTPEEKGALDAAVGARLKALLDKRAPGLVARMDADKALAPNADCTDTPGSWRVRSLAFTALALMLCTRQEKRAGAFTLPPMSAGAEERLQARLLTLVIRGLQARGEWRRGAWQWKR